MSKPLNFEGYAYHELIEYFDLFQKQIPVMVNVKHIDGIDETIELFKKSEVVTRSLIVNGSKIEFEISEQTEVELIKLKQFLQQNETNKEVVNVVKTFIAALIKQSEKLDYNAPGFKGILEIEDDSTFMEWVIGNVENMWV